MAISYLNTKIYGQIETLDHLDSKNFASIKDYRAEKKHLLNEYVLAGGHGVPYWSSRSTKTYKG